MNEHFNDPNFDHKAYKQFEESIKRITLQFLDIFHNEFKKGPGHGKAAVHAAVFAPLTFSLAIFEKMHEFGVKPNEEYPTFIQVYLNYVKGLEETQCSWKNKDFPEFQKDFIKAYRGMGHFVVNSEDQNQ